MQAINVMNNYKSQSKEYTDDILHNNEQNMNLNNQTKITDDTELSFVDVDDGKCEGGKVSTGKSNKLADDGSISKHDMEGNIVKRDINFQAEMNQQNNTNGD